MNNLLITNEMIASGLKEMLDFQMVLDSTLNSPKEKIKMQPFFGDMPKSFCKDTIKIGPRRPIFNEH